MSYLTQCENLAAVVKELVFEYKDDNCDRIIERMGHLKVNYPMVFQNFFVREIYISTHFKYGYQLMKDGNYEEARNILEKLLAYENEFMLDNELTAYELYSRLSDTYSMCQEHEKASAFNEKAKKLIKKMMATKEVQNLYLLMTKNDYRGAITAAKKVDKNMVDDYNLAKLNMVLGNAHFNLKHYKTAVDYLNQAITYYEEKTYNSLTVMMYEELSKCYSHLEEHELAVEYMQKSLRSQQKRHEINK